MIDSSPLPIMVPIARPTGKEGRKEGTQNGAESGKWGRDDVGRWKDGRVGGQTKVERERERE